MKVKRFEGLECWKEARKPVKMLCVSTFNVPTFNVLTFKSRADRRMEGSSLHSNAVILLQNRAGGFTPYMTGFWESWLT